MEANRFFPSPDPMLLCNIISYSPIVVFKINGDNSFGIFALFVCLQILHRQIMSDESFASIGCMSLITFANWLRQVFVVFYLHCTLGYLSPMVLFLLPDWII